MKYLLLVVLSLGLKSELDLTIPEQPAVYVPPKEFIINLGDYNEPPTRNQMIVFWTLNALDVYTTYEGLKKPNIVEANPLLGDKPHLDNLLIQKTIVAGFISQNSSKNAMTVMNTVLGVTVINNYSVVRDY